MKKLDFLHDFQFAHRDIKPGNILIFKKETNKYEIKYSDYGTFKKSIGTESLRVAGTVIKFYFKIFIFINRKYLWLQKCLEI